MEQSTKKVLVASVRYLKCSNLEYNYLVLDSEAKVGDIVLVDANNHEVYGIVADMRFYYKDNMPYPYGRLKPIIKRIINKKEIEHLLRHPYTNKSKSEQCACFKCVYKFPSALIKRFKNNKRKDGECPFCGRYTLLPDYRYSLSDEILEVIRLYEEYMFMDEVIYDEVIPEKLEGE